MTVRRKRSLKPAKAAKKAPKMARTTATENDDTPAAFAMQDMVNHHSRTGCSVVCAPSGIMNHAAQKMTIFAFVVCKIYVGPTCDVSYC